MYTGFGELHHKHSRRLDGIQRTPYALTMESTYRLMYGQPDVNVIAIFRWPQLPAATSILNKSKDLGRRLGRNTILLPVEGYEEEYWNDATMLFQQVGNKINDPVAIDSNGVYITICSCEPIEIKEANHPFITFDITALNDLEITALFSKLLDMFDVNFRMMNKNKPITPGSVLLSTTANPEMESQLQASLMTLAEISLVLEKAIFSFYCFNQVIKDKFIKCKDTISGDSSRIAQMDRIKESLKSENSLKKSINSNEVIKLVPSADKRDIFVCHRSNDKAVVSELVSVFTNAGISVWFDEAEIKWGDNIISRMNEGILKSKYVLVCIGKSFLSGNYAKYELELALRDEISYDQKKVLPLFLSSDDDEINLLIENIPAVRAKSYRTLMGGFYQLSEDIKSLL